MVLKEYKDRLGRTGINNQGCRMKIIDYRGATDCDIQFECGYIARNRLYSSFIKGTIKNLYHPSVHNEGYEGEGRHLISLDGEKTTMYVKWNKMHQRCYSEQYHKKQPTYVDCFVLKEWKCFQIFGDWFEENYNPETMQGWELDKDILFKGNKIYSPETCCFVPQEINKLFTNCNKIIGDLPIGVSKNNKYFSARLSKNGKSVFIGNFKTVDEASHAYIEAKEEYSKELANKWRGQITEPCYWALMNYQVEETD